MPTRWRIDAARAWRSAVAAGENRVAVRSGVALVARVTPVAAVTSRTGSPVPDPAGTAVVAGADTARGAALAEHLAEAYGFGRILLIAESGRGALAAPVRARLAAAGTRSRLVERTPGSPAGAARALAALGAPVTVAACAWDPGTRTVAEVLAAVGTGIREVCALAGTAGKAALLLCASADGTPADGAQAALQEAAVRELRGRGTPAIALEFGPWDAGGERAALAMLDAALTAGTPRAVVRAGASPVAMAVAPAIGAGGAGVPRDAPVETA